MLKATTAASVSLDSLSQRMSAGNFLVFAVFQLFHFLHVFLLGHTLTGSKFLLLFSIKSKEEILCFAERVPNGRSTDVAQASFLVRLRPIGACAAAFSCPREVIPLRPSKKELFSSFFVNSLKTAFPHPLWFLQYNPRHAPQTHPCPHSRTPQQCRESQWHARPQCQISCPQS